MQLKDKAGELRESLNDALEWIWYEFGQPINASLTVDGTLGHLDLDKLILRTLLIDGEVFIRIHRNAKNEYGLSFELIDAMSIDFTKNREASLNLNAIVNGVEVDHYFKPVAYHIKPGNTTTYQYGQSEIVPAKDMIHIFKKEFPQQVRGIPMLNCCLDSLAQLDHYAESELTAARASACMFASYERTGSLPTGDFLENEAENEDKGVFEQDIVPGRIGITPNGWTLKQYSANHPNNGFDAFQKAILKRLAASLGVSYNNLIKDYDSASYSSLKEGTIDAKAFFEDLQTFLISNWKDIEFKLFLQSAIVNSSTELKASELKDALRNYKWISYKRAYNDPSREIVGTEREINLGIRSPLEVIESDGRDVNEVMKSWKLWNDLCKKNDLNFSDDSEQETKLSFDDQDMNSAANQNQMLNSERQ